MVARAGPGRLGCRLVRSWCSLGRPEGRQGQLSANTENKRRASNADGSSENKNEMETGQSVMDSCNRIYHGVENEEIYLRVVVVVAATRRFARKSSPEVRRKPSLFRTSASDLGAYGWRLWKRVVLLEPLCREEHRHIYSPRVWKSFGIS